MTIMKLLEYKFKSISSTILGFTSIIFTTLFSTSLSLHLSSSLASSPLSSFPSTHFSTLPYTHQTDRLSSSKFCAQPSYLPTPTSLTALASFPGSGNTWIRYLIQQSSGYLTGSVYHDAALSIRGFPGEGISNGSMIVVKTHEHGTSGRQPFNKAIFLLRNPFKVLLSEFNRRSGGHLGHAPVSKLNDTGWRNYVLKNVDHWSSFTLDWLNFKGPLLITRYEDFLNNLQSELNRVLNFLGVNSTQERLDCVDKHRNGWKRRPQHFLPFDPFSMPSTPSSTNMTESIQAVHSSQVVPSLRQVVERKRKLVYQAVNKYLHQSGQLSSISELP